MPEVTDPRILAQLGGPQPQQLPTQPQAFPGALPTVNARRAAQQNAQTQTGLAVEAGARADKGLELSTNANAREDKKFRNAEKDRELNSGVETNNGQDLSAGHAVTLLNEVGILNRLGFEQDPRALKPSLGEVGVRGMTNNPDALAWSQSPLRQRAEASFNNILESIIYLKTGAAANKEQVDRLKSSVVPGPFDSAELLQDRKLRLLAEIESAKVRAGPGKEKILEALQALELSANKIYEPVKVAGSAPSEDRQSYSGGDLKTIPVNPEYQAEYSGWMQQQTPGRLTVPEYVAFRNELSKKYGLEPYTLEGNPKSKDFVDAFNAQEPTTDQIPGRQVPAELPDQLRESLLGSGGLNAGVANAGNALSMYTAEMLSPRLREGLEVAREQSGGASMAGEVAGSLSPAIAGEKLLMTGLSKLGMNATKSRVLADLGVNAALGGAAEGARAEEGSTMLDTLEGSVKGVLSSLAMRGLVKGGRGFAGEQGLKNRELLGPGSYNISEGRTPFPVDEATPAKFQALSDDELLNEVTEAQRGLDAWKAYQQQARVAASQGAPLPEKPNVPHPDALNARMDRVKEYLEQSPEVKTGSFPEADLTTMQRAGMGDQEEGLQSLPFIHGAREKAQASWNTHNSNRVLARIGETLPKGVNPGQEANVYVNKQLSAAYDKLRPQIKGPVDNGFRTAVNALRASAKSPKEKELFGELEEALGKFAKADGTYDGQGYREFSTQVRRLQEIWGKNDTAETTAFMDMARTAEKLRKQGQALVARNNPALGRRLKTVEGAWAHQARIEMASASSGAMSSRGVYTPDQLLSSIKRLDTSKGKTAVSRGKAFDQDYATAAREMMGGAPVKKPTLFGTLLGASALGGANATGVGALPVNLAAALMAAGHTPGLKRLMQGKIGEGADAFGKKIGAPAAVNEETLRQLLTQALRTKMQ